eukprot:Em0001g3724a
MRTFGSSWKEASINGKVVSITRNTWRVEWSIGDVGITLDHGKSFWKPKKTPLSCNGADAGCTSIAENPLHEAIEEEEDHRNEDIEDDVPEEKNLLEGGERDGTDPLECKLGDEVLKWETMEGGVTIDQRAKDGCSDRQFKFLWPHEAALGTCGRKKPLGFCNQWMLEEGLGWHKYQEGQDRMQLKKWCDQYPKHVALVLRLSEMLHGKGHIVYGEDSYFTSVKALLEHGTYYLGMLKTASAGFPKKYLQSLAWNDDATRGETCTVQHTVKMKRVQKIIFGHAWNEPGTVGLPKKILCGSAHHTLSTDPHVKVRWQLNDVTGSSERITCTVPRTSAVKEYFQAACIIDEHNHLRQGELAMEDAVATNDWWFRVFCTISGITMVSFVEKLTVQLLTNNRAGAPEKTAEQVQIGKLKLGVMEREVKGSQNMEHLLDVKCVQ